MGKAAGVSLGGYVAIFETQYFNERARHTKKYRAILKILKRQNAKNIRVTHCEYREIEHRLKEIHFMENSDKVIFIEWGE